MSNSHQGAENGAGRAPEGRVQRARGLLVQAVGEEVVILNPELDQVHQLNPTATLIWSLADQGVGPRRIAGIIAERFDISEEKAYQDAKEVLDDFVRLRLLTVTNASETVRLE